MASLRFVLDECERMLERAASRVGTGTGRRRSRTERSRSSELELTIDRETLAVRDRHLAQEGTRAGVT